jgi:hypothetical protein
MAKGKRLKTQAGFDVSRRGFFQGAGAVRNQDFWEIEE